MVWNPSWKIGELSLAGSGAAGETTWRHLQNDGDVGLGSLVGFPPKVQSCLKICRQPLPEIG